MPEQPTENKLTDEQIIASSPFKHAIKILRNGVTETLKVFVGTRADWEGRPYAAVQLEETNLEKGIEWLGKTNVVKMLNTILRRVGQDNVLDAYDGDPDKSFDGMFSIDSFIKAWENFAAAGLKISELKELLDAEQIKFQNYVSTEALAVIGNASSTPEEKVAITKNIEAMRMTINDLRLQLEKRSQKRSKEVNTEQTMNK